MPDLVTVLARRWKPILLLTLMAGVLSLLICLFMPKKYLGMATALAANPALSDKARILNQNIEALYTELGSPDDLDRIEGTAKLDTVYLALAKEHNLVSHYALYDKDSTALYQAAIRLKKNTTINRTGYGELRVKVWDKNNGMAAALANATVQVLNNIHQAVQTENNRLTVQRLKEEYRQKQQTLQDLPYKSIEHDSSFKQPGLTNNGPVETVSDLKAHLAQYARLINEYEMSLKTAPQVLLVVEKARPMPWPDKPKTAQTVLIATFATLLFAFLLALFIDSRSIAT